MSSNLNSGDLIFIPQCAVIYEREEEQYVFLYEAVKPSMAVYLSSEEDHYKIMINGKISYVNKRDVFSKYVLTGEENASKSSQP